jgi:glycosyltransferase involved in cell wall biosynthesis
MNMLFFRRTLIESLLERGTEVLAALPPDRHTPKIQELGVEVVAYPLARGSMNPATAPVSIRALNAIISKHRPDIAHSFTHQPNILTRFAAPRGTTVVNSVTGLGSCFLGSGIKGSMVRGMFHRLYRSTAGRCRLLLFMNEDDRGYFLEHRLAGSARVETVRGSGVDLQRFRPDLLDPRERDQLRAELGIGPEKVVVSMAARLIRDKGVFEFLEAARLLEQKHPEACFLLVGESDPGNPGSLDASDMRPPANLVQAGWREDMSRIWAASDLAVLPSYREGLPVTLQEAAATGLPLVAADVPGSREIVNDGENGYLVAVADANDLAGKLSRLIRDPDLRRRHGRESRELAEREFDAKTLAMRIVSLYDEIIDAEGP